MGEGGGRKESCNSGFCTFVFTIFVLRFACGGFLHFFFVLENVCIPHNAVINFLRMVSPGGHS